MTTGPTANNNGLSATRTPGPIAILVSVGVAMVSGGMVFFGTCLGSTLVTMNFLFSTERPWAVFVLWGAWAGSALVGLIVTFFVGRNLYRRAKRNAAAERSSR